MNKNNLESSPVASIGRGLTQGSAIGLQEGCLGSIITIGALLLGLWLDGQLHTKPWLTIILMLVSIPLSVYAIFHIALRAARSLQAPGRSKGEDQPE